MRRYLINNGFENNTALEQALEHFSTNEYIFHQVIPVVKKTIYAIIITSQIQYNCTNLMSEEFRSVHLMY